MLASDWEAEQLRLTTEEEQTVREHMPLVRWIASRIIGALPVHVEMEDLIQTGIVGLIDALRRYDPGKGIPFPAYARYRIRGEMLDSLRALDWATRSQRKLRRLAAEAGATEVPRPGIRFLSLGASGSAAAQAGRMEPMPQTDVACAADLHPDRFFERKEASRLVGRALDSLPARYRKVVLMYYRDDCSMRDIGLSLGVNESRVSQIHKAALRKMKKALELERAIEAAAALRLTAAGA
jgi:RNA polymerase sigma factor for flagellar operon FliA